MRAALLLSAVLLASPAAAWFDGGHRLIASLAMRRIEPARRAELADILRQHPMYAQDFGGPMPAAARGGDAEADYLMQMAAVWPDVARNYEGETRLRFDRPRWHYLEWQVFMDDDSLGILSGRLDPIAFSHPGGLDHPALNAVQAVDNSRAVLADPLASDEEKAVHVCWVAHLVGDLHQPCHAASLYSKSMYRTGNKGGNWTPVEPGENMHLFWDGLLGEAKPESEADFLRVRSRADDLAAGPEFEAISAVAAVETRSPRWAYESHTLAKEAVYTPDLLGYLTRMEADRVKSIDLPPFVLEEPYQRAALKLAERRAVEAAARLAAVLSE